VQAVQEFSFHTNRIAPQSILVGAWLGWLVCFLAMPVFAVFYGTFESISIFICANLALFCGLSSSTHAISNSIPESDRLNFDGRHIRVFLICLVAAGSLAIACKAVDLIAYRRVLSAKSFFDARERMQANGLNLFSGVHFILSPAITAAGIMAIPLFRRDGFRRPAVAALVVFFLNPMYTAVFGARSLLVMTVALFGLTWILTTRAVSIRTILRMLALAMAVFAVTMYLFVSRSIDMVGAQVDVLARQSHYMRLVPLNASSLIAMRDAPEFVRFFLYYLMSVGAYVIHGFFEFFYIVVAKDHDGGLLLGKYQFNLFELFEAVIKSSRPEDLEKYNPASGVFSTFWGPAYIDFGYLMVLYGLILGYLVSLVRGQVNRGDLFALPLYVLSLFQILLVPISNGIMLSPGVVANIGLLGIWLFARLYCKIARSRPGLYPAGIAPR
jgi:hypothetical protein